MVVNSQDAASRGIKNGDIVRAYNGRGQSLFWAHVSDLVMPGTAMAYYGRWPSFDTPGVPGALDRAGNVENLCRGGFISPYDNQQDVQATVQYEKWQGSV
jgi:anaerobic selenocysteine-containing dehydrogenase